jgi:electron transfer flavoprotein beta subunit
MRVIVALKQVPDTSATLRAPPGALEPHAPGVPPVVNPYDEFALEAALRIRERAGEGEVVLLTLAADPVEETVFHGLAMGAERAVVLRLPRGSAPDALAAGELLACAAREISFDAIFCGERAVDDDAAQVGPTLAERLGLPLMGGAEEVWSEESGRSLRARCRRGEGAAILRADLPCVVSFVRGPELPRYPSLDDIFAAGGKPVELRDVVYHASLSRTRRVALAPPFEERAGETVSGTPVDDAVEWLRERLVSRALIP